MQIDFSELEELLSPLTAMCKKEDDRLRWCVSYFKATDTRQKQKVQRCYQTSTTRHIFAVEFADVFRKETLSRAIVQINAMDLRGVKTRLHRSNLAIRR